MFPFCPITHSPPCCQLSDKCINTPKLNAESQKNSNYHNQLHRLSLVTCFNSELLPTFGRTPWVGNWCDARHLSPHDSTTPKDEDKHPCLKQDWNPTSHYTSSQDRRLRPCGHCDQRKITKYKIKENQINHRLYTYEVRPCVMRTHCQM
jgi:hypothetical protein